MPPPLAVPIADPHRLLGDHDMRRIERTIKRIENRFPQLRLAVALQRAPAGVPLGVYTFWLFNRGGLSSPVERGGDNHLVLLVIDPGDGADGQAAAMLGYGLEPLISREQLSDCLASASSELARGRFAAASVVFFSVIEPILFAACQNTSSAAAEWTAQSAVPSVPPTLEAEPAPPSP